MSSSSGFDMLFRLIGIDPQMFASAVQEIQTMAFAIAARAEATDQKMERIENKLDLIMTSLDLKLSPTTSEAADRLIKNYGFRQLETFKDDNRHD